MARKEMREWLNIIGVLLIPLLIGAYTIVNNIQQTDLAQQNRQADVTNQLDQQRETTLKIYMDDIKDALLNRGLKASRSGDEIRLIMTSETIVTLRRLDESRKGIVVRFLSEARLINMPLAPARESDVIISLLGVDLHGVDISLLDLSEVDLFRASLVGADLHCSDLYHADLAGTNLRGSKLINVNLNGANLSGADLRGAKLTHKIEDSSSPACTWGLAVNG